MNSYTFVCNMVYNLPCNLDGSLNIFKDEGDWMFRGLWQLFYLLSFRLMWWCNLICDTNITHSATVSYLSITYTSFGCTVWMHLAVLAPYHKPGFQSNDHGIDSLAPGGRDKFGKQPTKYAREAAASWILDYLPTVSNLPSTTTFRLPAQHKHLDATLPPRPRTSVSWDYWPRLAWPMCQSRTSVWPSRSTGSSYAHDDKIDPAKTKRRHHSTMARVWSESSLMRSLFVFLVSDSKIGASSVFTLLPLFYCLVLHRMGQPCHHPRSFCWFLGRLHLPYPGMPLATALIPTQVRWTDSSWDPKVKIFYNVFIKTLTFFKVCLNLALSSWLQWCRCHHIA